VRHVDRREVSVSRANEIGYIIFQLNAPSGCIALETEVDDLGGPQDESHLVIKGGPSIGTEDTERARWKKATDDHKKYVVLLSNLHTLMMLACSWSTFKNSCSESVGSLSVC